MPVVLYPIVVIVIGIIFYVFAKKNDPENVEVPNEKEILPPALPYKDENQQDFTWRCYNFIVDRFNRAGFRYHVSNNNSFLISYEREDGSLVNHNIDSVFNNGNSIILFYNRLTDRAVPDHKLADVAELVNRLNDYLFIGGIALNYEHRVVECKLVYLVAGHELSEHYFNSYYDLLYYSNNLRDMFKRVIEEDENPALVALEWSNN